MVITHLAAFKFVRGASPVAAPPVPTGFKGYHSIGVLAAMRALDVIEVVSTGFKGYHSVGPLAMLRGISSDLSPVDEQSSMKPLYFRRRR